MGTYSDPGIYCAGAADSPFQILTPIARGTMLFPSSKCNAEPRFAAVYKATPRLDILFVPESITSAHPIQDVVYLDAVSVCALDSLPRRVRASLCKPRSLLRRLLRS